MHIPTTIARVLFTILALFICNAAIAQDISFFHLSKKDGLSDNRISGVVMDKNGMLWVSTSEGLNCYDGYTVKRFYKEEYPALQNNNILRMACDENNRLWIHFIDKSITMLDENRQFHTISIMDNGLPVVVDFLLPYTSRGILLMSGSRLYRPDKNDPLRIERLSWKEDSSLNHDFSRINTWDKDKLVCSGNNRLCLFDVTNLKVLHYLTIPDILAAVKLNEDEALITTGNHNKLSRVNFATGKIVKSYGHLKDQFGEEMMNYPRSIYHLRDDQFIFTSAYAGLYLFDAAKETLYRYKHDPIDPNSISANNTSYLFSDTSGYFFITSNSGGLNYFNIHHYLARWQPAFRDEESGKIFDGYVNCAAQSPDGNLWLGTQNSLIEWNRKSNTMHFHSYGSRNSQPFDGTEEVRAICFDKNGRMWIGLNRHGVVVLDQKHKVIKYFNTENNSLSANFIWDIKEAPDGKIWIATSQGINVADPETLRITDPGINPWLKVFNDKNCRFIWFRNRTEVWVATNEGAYMINLRDKNIQVFDKKSGLENEVVSCIAGDKMGNIYIGTMAGMHIMNAGKMITFYNRTNGLRSNKCEGLLADDNGRIWIGNNTALVCYDPAGKTFRAYDQGAGLSDAGFRSTAFFKERNGEIIWGSNKGVNYFDPVKLQELDLPLNPLIHSLITPDSSYWLAGSKHFTLPRHKNFASFSFSAIDLYGSENIRYKYKLEGADDSWKIITSPREIQYSGLSSGNYTFRLMASRDGRAWINAGNEISVTILAPWWKSGWFVAGAICIVLVAGGIIMYKRNRKIKRQQEQIETERAINYFASSMYEQTSVDDILWDVTRNCISRLQFEDCVIYLKDEYRNVLIQKAAWGPKTTDENKILNPIEIPVGKGMVGAVAASGEPEIVNDTSKDARYIVDDVFRFSEITVPIIYNGNILGVIDSEHSRKNFFNQKHLSILTTIASLCANKLVRVRAETESQKAQLKLLDNQRITAEAQLKSLRLQMNPHFLFNSLNSIQQIILSGDEKAATLYLSKFSRLLRLVLSHSDKEKVTLKEEMETLQLYVALESLRFKESFHYDIISDDAIDTDEIMIPTLLIQPFVENAIWHGLLQKEGERFLTIKFSEDAEENIVCFIQDNGIGRSASKKFNGQRTHKSMGISVAEQRLISYNRQHSLKSKVSIEDLKDMLGNASGTKVTLVLPLLN